MSALGTAPAVHFAISIVSRLFAPLRHLLSAQMKASETYVRIAYDKPWRRH